MSRVLALCLLGLAAVGCGPTYPNCNSDEDCNNEKPRNEFCVNQKCQQCRNDKDCASGKYCNKGRCDEVPGYCEDDRGCPPEQTCQNHKCTACQSDDQCGEGGKCKQGACVRKGRCNVDDDCPEGQDCKSGVCTSAAPKRSSQDAPCRLAAVYFDFNESALSTEAADALEKNASCIKMAGRGVQLIGRTDDRGTEEYNLALSERRAQSVKSQLQRLGIDGNKMRTLPKGELEATGRNEQGWEQDRRVDFEWM